jgi:hypothetical protein
MAQLQPVEEMFKRCHFDREIIILCVRAKSGWFAARQHETALVEIPEQPDRAGPSGV